ncbi:MAG: Hsp20/alpha crystallin family protein [Promethearchaeota archaeon]
MAIVNKDQDTLAKTEHADKLENTSEQPKLKYKIRPKRYFNYDCAKNTWELEFHLPGVAKDKVTFKVMKDSYSLEAIRDVALYTSNGYLPFEIDMDSVNAKYSDGLLSVLGNIKDPLADAVEIKLN